MSFHDLACCLSIIRLLSISATSIACVSGVQENALACSFCSVELDANSNYLALGIDPNVNIEAYLSSFEIKDVNAKLNVQELECLRRIFISLAMIDSRQKWHGPTAIETSLPIYQLLKNNLPDVGYPEFFSLPTIELDEIRSYLYFHGPIEGSEIVSRAKPADSGEAKPSGFDCAMTEVYKKWPEKTGPRVKLGFGVGLRRWKDRSDEETKKEAHGGVQGPGGAGGPQGHGDGQPDRGEV
jgi:hypothetical protein